MNNLSIRKMTEVSKKKKKGFTLVELIIVIAIIAILAAIAIPKFGQIRENANVKADIANAKNIQTALTTAVSNGDIKLTEATQTFTAAQIATYLDSSTTPPVPKARLATAGGGGTGVFVATISISGDVTVTAGGIAVFPNPGAPYNS